MYLKLLFKRKLITLLLKKKNISTTSGKNLSLKYPENESAGSEIT